MEIIKAVTELLRVILWPLVVLVLLFLSRREIRTLFGRVRGIEGPGDVKVTLDPYKAEEIIEEGRRTNAPSADIAKRIAQSAPTLDTLEKRILRGLFDDDGRAMYSYQDDYYRNAFANLRQKGYIEKLDRGFRLTDEGKQLTKEYLKQALETV